MGIFFTYSLVFQVFAKGTVVLKNKRESRKGDKMSPWWLGPYLIDEALGKGVYRISNQKTGKGLKKCVNQCRLKLYYEQKHTMVNVACMYAFLIHTRVFYCIITCMYIHADPTK